jgi:hypothetical protein
MAQENRPNPNRKPFPRAAFVESAVTTELRDVIHPLKREALEPGLRQRDPRDWRHTLGAYDVFLDNLGLVFAEQFSDPGQGLRYFETTAKHLTLYRKATRWLQPDGPWWGDYLLGKARRSNAGEPRPFLRLMAEGPLDGVLRGGFERNTDIVANCDTDIPSKTFESLPWHLLLPEGMTDTTPTLGLTMSETLGVPLPPEMGRSVPPLWLLSPKEATPDLPLRVGRTAVDVAQYRSVFRSQGPHPTCVAYTVAMALTLAARRTRRGARCQNFSASWIHYASSRPVQGWSDGRSLESAIEQVRSELPCAEKDFTYPAPHEGHRWKTSARASASETLSAQLGPLEVVTLAPSEIARTKTLLAAGWLVVITTSFPKNWWQRGFLEYGLPMLPLEGEPRESMGHAWLLIGYDHVDGNPQWRYQGRFIALNSMGPLPANDILAGLSLCSIPFSFFLTEAIQAYALRFPESNHLR